VQGLLAVADTYSGSHAYILLIYFFLLFHWSLLIIFLTLPLHLILGLSKGCLFDIFIFEAVKRMLLLSIHNTFLGLCVLNFTDLSLVFLQCNDMKTSMHFWTRLGCNPVINYGLKSVSNSGSREK
jgi:hypothetical protein